jgi:hypothetical protein
MEGSEQITGNRRQKQMKDGRHQMTDGWSQAAERSNS